MRRLLTLLAAATALLAIAVPAGAASSVATIHDEVGDVGNGRGDITKARLVHGSGRITVSMQMAVFSNPYSNPNWIDGYTSADWFLDIGGGRAVEYQVYVFSDGTFLRGEVYEVDGGEPVFPEVCDGIAGTDPDTRNITFRFPRNCIGAPDRVRFYASFDWDKQPADPGTRIQRDVALGNFAENTYSSWATFPSS